MDERMLNNETCMFHDLGVAGEDGDDLMLAYAEKFNVSLEGMDLGSIFGDESSGNPIELVSHLLGLRKKDQMPCLTIADLQQGIDTGSLNFLKTDSV